MNKIIIAQNLVTKFGENTVHDKISFEINKNEIYGLLGGSGSGKTTLMREMLLLQKINSGTLSVLGEDVSKINEENAMKLRHQWGVLFQFGALFSSLTILENIMFPLEEYTKLSKKYIEELAFLKLKMTGLNENVAFLYPSQLSGGMKKRAGLARAIAMDPKILFLDEPTSGLDPSSARAFDELILKLKQVLDSSVIMVTHDKESIKNILDKFIVLENKKIVFEGSYDNFKNKNPIVFKRFME